MSLKLEFKKEIEYACSSSSYYKEGFITFGELFKFIFLPQSPQARIQRRTSCWRNGLV